MKGFWETFCLPHVGGNRYALLVLVLLTGVVSWMEYHVHNYGWAILFSCAASSHLTKLMESS